MFRAVPVHPRTKIIHFVRHAEGEHNVVGEVDKEQYKREDLEDAHLSEFGVQQCRELHSNCVSDGSVDDAELLIVSPMRRTLQTAMHSFPHLIGKIPWIAHEMAREQTGIHPCDRRRPISELRNEYTMVDFDLVEDDHDPFYHLYTEGREPDHIVISRGEKLFEWLSTRPERVVIVVTHSAYLRLVLPNITTLGQDESHDPHFRNCEMRSAALHLEK